MPSDTLRKTQSQDAVLRTDLAFPNRIGVSHLSRSPTVREIEATSYIPIAVVMESTFTEVVQVLIFSQTVVFAAIPDNCFLGVRRDRGVSEHRGGWGHPRRSRGRKSVAVSATSSQRPPTHVGSYTRRLLR